MQTKEATPIADWREVREELWVEHDKMHLEFLRRSLATAHNKRRSLLEKVLRRGRVTPENVVPQDEQ